MNRVTKRLLFGGGLASADDVVQSDDIENTVGDDIAALLGSPAEVGN